MPIDRSSPLKPGAWRLAIVSTALKRTEIDAFVDQAKAEGAIPRSTVFRTKEDACAALREARQTAWSPKAAVAPEDIFPGKTRRRRIARSVMADRCTIPAAEVNAWLRSLPPEGLDP